jgi:hypothetical protein
VWAVITFQGDDAVEMHFIKSGECRVSFFFVFQISYVNVAGCSLKQKMSRVIICENN